MYYIDNITDRHRGEESKTMKTQQTREAREQLTREFVELLRLRPESGVRWTGSTRDLMEATHIVFVQGVVCNADGTTCTFRQLARQACEALHVRLPRYPYACVYQATQRKGVRTGSFIDRYARQLFMAGVEKPLATYVSRSRKEKETEQ